jgi:hypothetical protein
MSASAGLAADNLLALNLAGDGGQALRDRSGAYELAAVSYDWRLEIERTSDPGNWSRVTLVVEQRPARSGAPRDLREEPVMTRRARLFPVEVLAATAVFALVSALSVGLLMGALRTKPRARRFWPISPTVHRIAALLREDVGQIAPRPVRTADGLADPPRLRRRYRGDRSGPLRIDGPREIWC